MKVLIAVADTTYGRAIAEFVGNHNWSPDTCFKVIHAIQIDELAFISDSRFCCALAKDLKDERAEQAHKLVEAVAVQIRNKLTSANIEEETFFGKAKDVILDQADEWKADMIVIGSHGRTGLTRFLLGSVSLSVLSHAPCSVMIVKLPKQEETTTVKQKTDSAYRSDKTKTDKQPAASSAN
jgi:nucleotide-binding universal stress UspA family protein